MVNIAICDDEIVICQEVKNYIERYSAKEGIELSAELFTSGKELLASLSNERSFDLIFLDIKFKNENGSQIANIIRKKMNNYSVEIVYISSYTEYAMSLFETSPLDFLIKPLTYEKIEEALNKAINKLSAKPYVDIITKQGFKRIPVNKIMYFELDGRYAKITARDGEILSRQKMEELPASLPFLKIHKSFVINTNYIDEYRYKEMKMQNGRILPISRSYQKSVRAYYSGLLKG